ncbi:hypothetical protein HNP84_005990 [Thermocatellispora tengchongensis]|uniref:Transposase n=1 Tax=Thermocatellispora tengchongensis TaxID=1073253 RepID=A0A840PC31_9ACTN|nr:IS982 family transposase [Thermocatellispora tengchongensis]MBB5136246.1 hypothetical protein [Thermocatellispora tengchongensis]
MTTDLNTLLTALYVTIDDWLGRPPRLGRPPKLTDAELLTLAVAQALLGIHSHTRWLRYVPAHLPAAFPHLPGQSGYNKRLHKALPLLKHAIRALARDTDLWHDPVWVVDSTPVECGRSRPTTRRSNWPAGPPRLLPLPLPLVLGPAPEPDLHPRRTAHHLGPGHPEHRRAPGADGHLRPRPRSAHRTPRPAHHRRQGLHLRRLDAFLAERGVRLLRPSYRNRTPRPGEHLLKPIRQLIESVKDTWLTSRNSIPKRSR